jgi:two-component system nitrate/nitrite response regulator NarL
MLLTSEPGSEKLSVLLVDDHKLLADSVAAVISAHSQHEIDTVGDIDAAAERISEHGPYDAVLLDYDIPGMEGLAGLRRLVTLNGKGVALFSGVAPWSVVDRAIELGAAGFIPKTLPLNSLFLALRFIAQGETYIPTDYMRRVARGEQGAFGLRPREMRVLGFLCEGLQNKEIGRELGLDEVIVKMDVKSVCRKLNARNRTQAVIMAKKSGLF